MKSAHTKHISILTICPEVFAGYLKSPAVVGASGAVDVKVIDIRDFADGCFRAVDDSPYGGGPGLVLRYVPVKKAIASLADPDCYIIATTPSGARYDQASAQMLAEKPHLVIICGHYEGIDERLLERVDAQISVGDFVLTGGELPAVIICDSVIRLLND